MEPEIIALIIVIIGAVLITVEALSPGGFLVIPGVVLVIIGAIGYVYPDFLMSIYSPIAALLIAVPVTLITVKGYQILARPIPPSTMVSESLIGRTGTLTVASGPDDLKGKVKIGSEIWSARSEVEIEEGASVRIVDAKGVHVTVEKIGDE